MTAKELREKRAGLVKQSREILNRADAEKRDLTAEEDAQFKAINGDIDKLFGRIGQIERQEELERELVAVNDRGSDLRKKKPASAVDTSTRGARGGDGEELMPADEAFAHAVHGWMRVQNGASPTRKQRLAARQQKMNLGAKRLNLRLPVGAAYQNVRREILNAGLVVGTTTAGGFTVPQSFMTRLERAMLYFGPMLQLADVIRTSDGRSMPWPSANDTGNTGEQIDEQGSIGNTTDPTIGRIVLGAWKFSSKLVKISYELTEDSAFDLVAMLADILGERLGRIQNTRATTGVGTTTMKGVVVASTLGKTAASATAITCDEIIDLKHSVDVAYRSLPGAGFMSHDNIVAVVRKLKGGDGHYLWQPSLQAGQPDKFDGYPWYVNNDMQSSVATNTKTILFGAFSKYKIRQVGNIRMRRLVELYAATDEEGFVGFQRADGNLMDAGVAPVKHLLQA